VVLPNSPIQILANSVWVFLSYDRAYKHTDQDYNLIYGLLLQDDAPLPEDDENKEKRTDDISSWDAEFLKVRILILFKKRKRKKGSCPIHSGAL